MNRSGDVVEGEISQQRSSYRQGLVLGLTMAEIMVLLVFCLLIAMATFLKSEQSRRVEAEKKAIDQAAQFQRDNALATTLTNNPELAKKLESLSGSTDANAIGEFWRELVDSRAAMSELERSGLTPDDIRKSVAEFKALRSKNIDVDTALRNSDYVAKINGAMAKVGQSTPSIQSIIDAIEKGDSEVSRGSAAGHQWPPIITLSEDSGYRFAKGSAELTEEFATTLLTQTPDQILEFIRKYRVDVIEVVGHTDEQPIAGRPSNLDRDLLSVLNNTANVASLIPADNAGLGLARAVSVVSALRKSEKLKSYKLIPLSGAQLVNTDETLAVVGTPGDIPERRRIEIRLRKSVPRETTTPLPAGPAAAPSKPTPPASGPSVHSSTAAPPANRPVRPRPTKQEPLILTPPGSPPAQSLAPRQYTPPPYSGG